MGFEIYVECFGETRPSGLSRAAVRELFPIAEKESEHNYWRVQYDGNNSCDIGVTSLEGTDTALKSFYVDRPCRDPRLWDALLSVLRMGEVAIFWPGGPPVVGDDALGQRLPQDVIDSLGRPQTAFSVEGLLRLVRES